VGPEALVLYDGSIYIAASKAPAAARKRGDSTRRPTHDAHADAASATLRFYKLDRVSDARPTSRTFARQQASVETLLADSITIYRSDEPPRRYRLRVDPARARWAVEKPFHPRQRVWPQKDGGVILDIERAWDDEMIPQLLGLADCVEVLEPEDIRDQLLDIARRIAARYVCRHMAEFDAIRAEHGLTELT
jgi:predicted DNA-binding transcriptional regulator YafY